MRQGQQASGAPATGVVRRHDRSPRQRRPVSTAQVVAIQTVMQLLVEDDLSAGVAATARTYCDACMAARPQAGAIPYGRYLLCNTCATEYEVARVRALRVTAGQFVRDKRFGEAEPYALTHPAS